VSIIPGDDINFYVSSSSVAPYTFQIYRSGTDPNTPGSDVPNAGTKLDSTSLQQPIHPGSYIHVENRLPATAGATALTL
jgi:hypothetical protein